MPTSVEGLLGLMTLEEKAAQLTALPVGRLAAAVMGDPSDPAGAITAALPDLAPHGVGHFAMLDIFTSGHEGSVPFYAKVQEGVLACGRFPIPALLHAEALNGVMAPGAPTYPTGIAQAATWDPALVARMTELTRERLKIVGARLALSPVLDIARDPRWGRVHETYGEDPELAAAFGVAFVRGLQTGDLRGGIAACAKHFIGHAASVGGLHMAGIAVGPRVLREEYARPFAAVIREAGIATVMNAYAEVDGLPAAADPAILTGLLRDELGFDGPAVSDYGSVQHLVTRFGLGAGPDDAAVLALRAGLDVEFPDPWAFGGLAELVRGGRLDEADIDRAALRVLHLKERLGLLDHILRGAPRPVLSAAPLPDPAPEAEHGLLMARQAVVLLHNPDGVLPLRTPRVALVGTLADSVRVHYGAYTGVAVNEVRIVSREVREQAQADDRSNGDPTNTRFWPVRGFPERFEALARELEPHAVSVVAGFAADPDLAVVEALVGGPEGTSDDDLAAAAQAARQADVAVVVVGERTGRIGDVTGGEGSDRQSLRLHGDQEALIAAVAATGVPVVVVLVSGRPLLLDRVLPHAAAVLWAPLLGPHAGTAITDILTGRTAPSGRLPITFPASLGQLPIHHGMRAGSGYEELNGRTAAGYSDGPVRPQFAFGHGLTYTTFTYGDLDTATDELRAGSTIDVTVPITNTGARDAHEVVQLYAHDVVASVVRPIRQLLAFTKVHIPAGETTRVRLTAPVDALAFLAPGGKWTLEPGEITLMAGPSSDSIHTRRTIRITE